MKLSIKKFDIYVEESVLIIIFLSIIFVKIREYFENYFICYLFIVFHELSHMFVASLCGVKTTKLSIRLSGLNINLNKKNRNELKWVLIFVAGPISNLVLAIVFKNVLMVYTINLALAIINLIPIYPLDGYNILEIILNKLKIRNISIIQRINEISIIIILTILGLYQIIKLNNPSIFLMIFYIFIQGSKLRKKSDSRLYQKYYKNVTNFQKNY